jgi:hypothetical protein
VQDGTLLVVLGDVVGILHCKVRTG